MVPQCAAKCLRAPHLEPVEDAVVGGQADRDEHVVVGPRVDTGPDAAPARVACHGREVRRAQRRIAVEIQVARSRDHAHDVGVGGHQRGAAHLSDPGAGDPAGGAPGWAAAGSAAASATKVKTMIASVTLFMTPLLDGGARSAARELAPVDRVRDSSAIVTACAREVLRMRRGSSGDHPGITRVPFGVADPGCRGTRDLRVRNTCLRRREWRLGARELRPYSVDRESRTRAPGGRSTLPLSGLAASETAME